MKAIPTSSLLIALALGMAACAETRVTDHAAPSTAKSANSESLGRTLRVVETAFPENLPDRAELAAEAIQLTRSTLASVPGEDAQPDSEANLLALARAKGLDSVLVVRIEDYARRGNLYVSVAVPPVSWDTNTTISIRLRALETRTGTVIADVRRDRVRGGLFTTRTKADLPDEMKEILKSLVVVGG